MPPTGRSHATLIDPRDQAAYTLAEATRYVKVAPATLRTWVLGRTSATSKGASQFQPLIRPASRAPLTLSFSNLIEAHVLRSLRTDHSVSIGDVRTALRYAEKSLHIERLLLRSDLRSDAGQLFLDRYGQLINLSASGQLAMRRLLHEHLKRVEWDASMLPVRFYPFLTPDSEMVGKPIVIDPQIAFGRPVVLRRGISTSVIAERIDAGETVDDLAADYGLKVAEIEAAVLYERAA